VSRDQRHGSSLPYSRFSRPDESYITTRFLLLSDSLLMWSALCDERTGLSFTVAASPSQRSHFRVQVLWNSWPYFTLSHSRIPFSSPPTTRRATVEVFDPAPTRGNSGGRAPSTTPCSIHRFSSPWIHESTASYNFRAAHVGDTTLNSSSVVLLVVMGILCLAVCYLVTTRSLLYVVTVTWFRSRCSATDVWLWLGYSGFQPSCHNNLVSWYDCNM
jgi:hypothetical protein